MSSKVVIQQLFNVLQMGVIDPYFSMIDRTEQLDEPYELSEAEGAALHNVATQAYLKGRGEEMARTTPYLAMLTNHNEDFVALMIHFVGETGDKKLLEDVKKIIPKSIKDGVLAFNVCCLHAMENNKPAMLKAIAHALELGKTPDEFMEDEAFGAYHTDDDFIKAMGY